MSDTDNAGRTRGQIRTVTCADLVRSAGLLGPAYTFLEATPAPESELLHGRFETLRLRPGLILHAAAVRDLCDLHTENALDPALKIVAVVGGSTDLSFGHHRFLLGPQTAGNTPGRHGVLVNLAEPSTFSRRWQRHREEQKVSLTIGREWLEQGGYECVRGYRILERFVASHLARHDWQLSARAQALAGEILRPHSFQPGLQRLQLESRCLELVGEALASLVPDSNPAEQPLRAPERKRLARLDALLRSDEVIGMSSEEIARQVGSNPTTLQELARRTWNCTLFERLRQIRMDKAQACLRRGGSVAEAADIAGYASANNFSTAFRQRFGHPPSQTRRQTFL